MSAESYPRVGILADALGRWTGGIEFLRMCISAMNAVSSGTVEDVYIPSRSIQKSIVRFGKNGMKALLRRSITAWEPPSKSQLVDALTASRVQVGIAEFRETRGSLARAMRERHADVLFPCESSLGTRFPVPWIGYLPDVQHRQLPLMFSRRERWGRDKRIIRLLADAPAVVVNARSVKSDIERFYPNHGSRIVPLPFSPSSRFARDSVGSTQQLSEQYQLPHHYFMISNQFWKHKSHGTAFMALRHLHDAGYKVHLVCTGATCDTRWPEHFGALKDLINRLGIAEYIHILGLIPKLDQLAIMQGSLALIQPTLFEGAPGGGAVYDAVSLDVPSIVSDIPVNREIDIGFVRFFSAGSPEDLAEKLIDFLEDPPQLPTETETILRLQEREHKLGEVLLQTARSIIV